MRWIRNQLRQFRKHVGDTSAQTHASIFPLVSEGNPREIRCFPGNEKVPASQASLLLSSLSALPASARNEFDFTANKPARFNKCELSNEFKRYSADKQHVEEVMTRIFWRTVIICADGSRC